MSDATEIKDVQNPGEIPDAPIDPIADGIVVPDNAE